MSTDPTYLASNELEILRALGITVTSAVGGSRLVGRVLGQAAICVHGDKVQGAIDTTS
jgi:hypothetical protein